MTVFETFAVWWTFIKLIIRYTTDSKFSAFFLDENINKRYKFLFLALGYPLVICSLLLVSVFEQILVLKESKETEESILILHV